VALTTTSTAAPAARIPESRFRIAGSRRYARRVRLLAHTAAQTLEASTAHGLRPEEALTAHAAFFRTGELAPWIEDQVPEPARTLVDGDTVKFTLPLHDGLETESVVIPMYRDDRVTRTLCVSSQVGCAMGCTFCETAQMGLMRSLTPAEIVQQWFVARHRVENSLDGGRGFPIKNVVFMGMGEPTDNIDAVLQAIRVLTDHRGPGVPAANITVSTVGRVEGVRRLAAFAEQPGFRKLNIAFSLNAPNDALRATIMPITRAEPVAGVLDALRAWPVRRSAVFCMEYVLIPGVNDAPEHCDEVCSLLRGIKCSLNVIPYNPRRDSPWRAPTEAETDAFVRRAMANGQFCKRRGTKGRTAMAACGQLGNERIRRRRFVDLRVDA
jgi:23S rRNA (adenine2503-C2)-methyltransferase